MLAVECTDDPYTEHVQVSDVSSFSQYVVHGLLSGSGSDLNVCYPVYPRDAQYAPLPSVLHIRGHP